MRRGCAMRGERAVGPGRRRRRAARLAVAGVLCAILPPAATAELAVPAPSARALDQAGVLSSATESALEAMLGDLEAAVGAQVVVLTVPSLAGEPIESYALRVAETWGLGSRERDDGVLLVVAVEDRRTRIEVGYGLEGVLPDVVAGRIIRQSMVPHFRRGDFETGVLAGARQIADRLTPGGADAAPDGRQAASGAPPVAAPPGPNWDHFWAWIVFLLVMPAIGLVCALLGVDGERRGITFGALLLPLMLGGSLALDELVTFPPDSGKFLLGGVAVLAAGSALFWWLHFRLRRASAARDRWRARLDEAADGRLLLRAAAGLGLPAPSARVGRWLRGVVLAAFYAGLGVWIFLFWAPGYGIAYVHNLLWLIVIWRANLHPSPSAGGSGSWSGRSSGRVWSPARSSRSSSSGGGGGSGFRPGGGSFGGGGASGSW